MMIYLLPLIFACLAAVGAPAWGQPSVLAVALVHRDEATQTIDARIALQPRAAGADPVAWERVHGNTETRYLRFRFDQIAIPPDADLELQVVSDPEDVLVWRMRAAELARASELTTGLLRPGRYRIRVVVARLLSPASLRLAGMNLQAVSTARVPQAAVMRGKPLASLVPTHPARSVARSVAMLHIGPLGSTCTAFLIGDALMATNFHCLALSAKYAQSRTDPQPGCSDIEAEFDFIAANELGARAACTGVFAVDQARDLVILRIAPPPLAGGGQRATLKLSTGAAPDAAVRILHHPMGRPMVFEDHCQLQGLDEGDLLHDCGTMPGSSGSLLFTDSGEVAAVHYKAPFEPNVTVAEMERLYQLYGPLYNRAKPVGMLTSLLKPGDPR